MFKKTELCVYGSCGMAQKPCVTLAPWTLYGEVIIYNKESISDSLCLCVSIKKRTQAFPKEMETLEPVCYGVSD